MEEKSLIEIATVQGDDYTNGCLLDYPYFKENYKLIAVSNQEVSKQEELDADPKATQQIDFTGNIDSRSCMGGFHSWGSKRNNFEFFTRNYKSPVNMFHEYVLVWYDIKLLNITV